MNFKPAKFTARSAGRNVHPLRYVLRLTRSNNTRSLVMMITKQLAREAGIAAGDALRIDLDRKDRLGRLLPVTQGERRMRENKGSYVVQWPWNGELMEMFPLPAKDATSAVCRLEVAAATKSEGIIFHLPK